MKRQPFERAEANDLFRPWSLEEEIYDELNHQRSESLFALGNGYIGMRGNFEEGFFGEKGTSVTGNYLNGFYDSNPIVYPEGAYGYPSRNQSMLNVTNAQIIELAVENEPFHLHAGKILSHKRKLDMQKGCLERRVEWESPAGHRVEIVIRRMVALNHKHLAAIHYEVKAVNFSGEVSLFSSMDGRVSGGEATDDPRLGAGPAEPSLLMEEMVFGDVAAVMRQRTRHTRFVLLTGISHAAEAPGSMDYAEGMEDERMTASFKAWLHAGESLSLTKYISYHTSRDYAEEELLPLAEELHRQAAVQGFETLMKEQAGYLAGFWSRGDIEIEGDPALQQGIRFNAFQLLQSAGRDGVTNIGAKGLTGEGYEGHYFWDTELYVLPFFTSTQPDIARALLDFRYTTLNKARERAAVMSQKGALYPWRTIAGEENSAYYPAGTAQAHINADIAYAIRQYVTATGDMNFLVEKGAEILFETARFWADLGHFNPARGGAFCIDAVTGPDEYTAVVNNNAYTNLMAQSHLQYAYETAKLLKQDHPEAYASLKKRIGLSEEEPKRWLEAAERMYVPYDEKLGIYAQDDTFLSKKKWDFEHTPKDKYPLLLHFHPLVIYRHQVLKQADLVLAMFLLGEKFTLGEKKRNYAYYEPLTTHDSSLSPCIHSIMAAEIGDMVGAYDYFNRTVRMDLDDINGNAKDGLHTAAMAGSWMSIVYGFGGMRYANGRLQFDPKLPARWNGLRFRVLYQGRLLEVRMEQAETYYSIVEGEALTILHQGREVTVEPGEGVRI